MQSIIRAFIILITNSLTKSFSLLLILMFLSL